MKHQGENTIFDCAVLELPKIQNRAGNITPIHPNIDVPFDIKRVFYIYDIPGGEDRGAHAHKNCHQLLIAASGSFDVMLNDGINKKVINLNRPFYGLHIFPGIWAAEQNFSSGAICLVLTSEKYNPDDYLREYNEYIKFKNLYSSQS